MGKVFTIGDLHLGHKNMALYRGYLFTHVPVHSSELSRYRGSVHGHLHAKVIRYSFMGFELFQDKRYINVSCENVNYIPVEIIKLKTI